MSAVRDPATDQRLPVPSDRAHIADLVKADIDQRRELGVSKYGTALQAHNGRDALLDAYQEALDLVHYLRQAIEERDNPERVPSLHPARIEAAGRTVGGIHQWSAVCECGFRSPVIQSHYAAEIERNDHVISELRALVRAGGGVGV